MKRIVCLVTFSVLCAGPAAAKKGGPASKRSPGNSTLVVDGKSYAVARAECLYSRRVAPEEKLDNGQRLLSARPALMHDRASSDPEFTIGSDLCSGRPLAAKSRCTFNVTFTPAPPAGLKEAIVNATQTSDGAILASAAVSGTVALADCGVLRLAMTPTWLDFSTTGVGTPVGPSRLVVTNTGACASQALSVWMSDSTSSTGGASQFTYTSSCAAALAPAGSCQIDVTFAPTKVGSFAAVVNVSDNGVAWVLATVVGEPK